MIKSGDQFITGCSGGVVGALSPGAGHLQAQPRRISFMLHARAICVWGISPARWLTFQMMPIWPTSYIGEACQPTELGKPRLGRCRAEKCQAQHVLQNLRYILVHRLRRFAARQLPGPGDSGSPLVQYEKVVGLLLSLNMHTCKRIAISAETIKREMQV